MRTSDTDSALLQLLERLDATVLESVPAVAHQARRLVLDTLGCVMAGRRAAPVAALERLCAQTDPGAFRFPGARTGLSARGAALVTAMAACWDEACEGHAGAHGRPGVAALAALLPLTRGMADARRLHALVVGYEVGARFGAALRIRAGMHVDGNWPALGAAAAASQALGLGPRQTAQAVGIAACQLPLSLYLPVRTGDTARNTYLGQAAALGQGAALAAASSVTAPPGAAAAYAALALGQEATPAREFDAGERFHLLDTYFKPYAAVRHVHYGAHAAAALRQQADLSRITALQLRVYEEATVYCGNRAPRTALQAQFSLSFGVAAMLRWGRLDPWVYEEAQMQDPLLRRLEACVELEVDPHWTRQGERAAHLTMVLDDGTRTGLTATRIPGDPGQPLSDADLCAKFDDYCEGRFAGEAAGPWARRWLAADPNGASATLPDLWP